MENSARRIDDKRTRFAKRTCCIWHLHPSVHCQPWMGAQKTQRVPDRSDGKRSSTHERLQFKQRNAGNPHHCVSQTVGSAAGPVGDYTRDWLHRKNLHIHGQRRGYQTKAWSSYCSRTFKVRRKSHKSSPKSRWKVYLDVLQKCHEAVAMQLNSS